MILINDFEEYKVLELGNGLKTENWNSIILRRPETSAIWDSELNKKVDAYYTRSNTGGGLWNVVNKGIKDSWQIHYHELTFNLKLMGFKHTGLFPEQAYNWNYIQEKIKNVKRPVKVLNLFAYTGAASVAALSAGAHVVHVDSSRGMVDWAKENVKSSNLDDQRIRFIVDDVNKFVKREIRRGNKYDIILMDPPTFGRGSKKEIWNIDTDLHNLIKDCMELLSDEPLLFLINSYSNGVNTTVLENLLRITLQQKLQGEIYSDELGFKVENTNLVMPCGIFARWEK